MPSFAVSPEQGADAEHAWLLTISRELDASSAEPFDTAFDDVLDRGARLVTLDLSDVSFLDSTGLRIIVRAANRLAAREGRLTVAGLSGAAQRVLEITGLIDRLAEPTSPGNTEPAADDGTSDLDS
jgi:anti-anti-sigma factor